MQRYLIILFLPLIMMGQENDSLVIRHGVRFTSFSMSTQNGLFGPYRDLQDYYAQSFGLEYLGQIHKGKWWLDIDAYGTLLAAGNPFETDSLTGKSSRYESGLVAVDQPERRAILMPSIFELSYHSGSHRFGLGNFSLDGAFMNMEHGRMIPSTFSGVNYSYKKRSWSFKSALIGAIAARSTSSFKSVGESLAQYNPGLDTSGFVHDKTQVNAPLVVFGQLENVHDLAGWYGSFAGEVTIVPGVFGTYVVNEKLAHGPSLVHLQLVRQQKLGNGGNDDPELAYFQQERSQYYGLKYSHSVNYVDYSFAVSYIDGQGKLLFPREWGREYIVTFQGRERQEGMGQTLAMVAGASGKWSQNYVNHRGGVSTGIYIRPEPSNYLLNKYAMPSNQQTNIWWAQSWKGGRHTLLSMVVLKVPLSSLPISAGQTINKVDMANFNLVYRYTFFPA